ncbi:hypothetical protein P7K49_019941 [Saguinus oedipus]|uniref:Uncharacterized protein n=1 Tax=Saguinus oedipus TaxID=9490 RepID=A0ABQ9UYT5_SAGOE|nr:hypothetical protein P7K49_019941 [Saguinus oedipus]
MTHSNGEGREASLMQPGGNLDAMAGREAGAVEVRRDGKNEDYRGGNEDWVANLTRKAFTEMRAWKRWKQMQEQGEENFREQMVNTAKQWIEALIHMEKGC